MIAAIGGVGAAETVGVVEIGVVGAAETVGEAAEQRRREIEGFATGYSVE